MNKSSQPIERLVQLLAKFKAGLKQDFSYPISMQPASMDTFEAFKMRQVTNSVAKKSMLALKLDYRRLTRYYDTAYGALDI